jgi:hypothetical protein
LLFPNVEYFQGFLEFSTLSSPRGQGGNRVEIILEIILLANEQASHYI